MIINMNGAKAPETPSSVLQEKTVTPETLPTVIGPDEGYDGLSQVTVNPDAQLKAENIRSGKTIFGVEGSFVGEPQPMADPEAQFWMDLATTNSPDNPANAPAGLIQHPFQQYAFYNKYIGPEGLDLSEVGLPDNPWSGLTACKQIYHDADGKMQWGGDIILPEGSIGYGQCRDSLLKDVPIGLTDYNSAFVDTKFGIEKLVVRPENLPNNTVSINGFARLQCAYIENNSLRYKSLTLELPETLTKISGDISGAYGSAKMRLVMKATVPPALTASYYMNTSTIGAIVVPVGCLEAYQTASNWTALADIMEEGTE